MKWYNVGVMKKSIQKKHSHEKCTSNRAWAGPLAEMFSRSSEFNSCASISAAPPGAHLLKCWCYFMSAKERVNLFANGVNVHETGSAKRWRVRGFHHRDKSIHGIDTAKVKYDLNSVPDNRHDAHYAHSAQQTTRNAAHKWPMKRDTNCNEKWVK